MAGGTPNAAFAEHDDRYRNRAASLTRAPSIVIVSDRVDRQSAPGPEARLAAPVAREHPWAATDAPPPPVAGGYLERLPLACIAAGLVAQAEIWHHQLGGIPGVKRVDPRLAYRAFPLEHDAVPFDNRAMLDFVRMHGAPHVLVVYGLGVSAELLSVCANSIIVYNSIDAPALRVPPAVSRHFDLVLTGAEWQSRDVAARHPGMATAILPVGPEFAAIDQFRPLDTPKPYDLIYVAAAQAYKRHDILLDALERAPRDVRALLVFGYGEDAEAIRAHIARAGLSVDCIGPPGVDFAEVNRLMNAARFGVVCGRDDGAPAILTEYMLAGLPVLANADLACGRQYILPETGMLAAAEDFADAILTMRDTAAQYAPRAAVLARWTWPHTIARFGAILADVAAQKNRRTLISID